MKQATVIDFASYCKPSKTAPDEPEKNQPEDELSAAILALITRLRESNPVS